MHRGRVLPAGMLLVLMVSAGAGAAQSGARTGTTAVSHIDSSARPIIAQAIARWGETLAGVRRCRYEAFVKLVARDESEPAESARSVLLLAEVHSSAYWERPGRYQEVIEARHQPHRGGFGRQLVSVSEIIHLRRNRIELVAGVDAARSIGASGRSPSSRAQAGLTRYSLVSPIAADALEHYEYVLRDTLAVDGQRIFRVAIRPKSETEPLFTGTMDIADSTFDVVAMDLGVNDAVQFPTVSNLRYQQEWEDAGDGRWMPYEIRLSGEVRLKLSARWLPRTVAGVHLPEFPRQVSFEQVAALTWLTFDQGQRPPDLPEYRIVLRDQADHPDSGTWSAPEAVPLNDAERVAWAQSDSEDRHPAFVPRMGRGLDAAQRAWLGPGFFHFNRVDGVYLGAFRDWRATPAVVFTTRLGYGFGSRIWQYRVGGRLMLSTARRIWVGAFFHDETVGWPALSPGGYDPTASALVQRVDPNDYYRERGLTLSLGAKVIDFTRLELWYDDVWQSSQDTIAGSGFRLKSLTPVPNPPIHDGRLRSISATVTFDSRQLVRARGSDYQLGRADWTRVTLGAQVAAPGLIPNDFAFQRYAFQVEHQRPILGIGITTVTVAGGVATHGAPPQRYFTVGFVAQLLAAEGTGFNTLARTEYAGNRALMVSVRHDFGRLLFRGIGLPVLRGIPATLSLHGGVFWAELVGNTPAPSDTMVTTAPRPYTEAGFTLGNLTPFLSPFDLAASFTWQLSAYPTRHFRFGLGISGP